MIYHNIYNSWAWTGGHADGNENLVEVALKEAEEQYNKYIKLLDSEDWKYFAKTDLEEIEKQIKEVEEIKLWSYNKKFLR